MPTPSWFEIAESRLDAEGTPARRERLSVGLNFYPAWMALLQRAARERGMSTASYARRAVMAFVLHDLGEDWDTVMADEPKLRGYGIVSVHDNKHAAGQGFGHWIIERLRGE